MLLVKKKLAVICMAIVAFVCAIFGITSTVNASADEVNDTAETVAFGFESGASVRVTTESTGLRFMATMSPTEYEALMGNTEYDSVSFGMIIVPKDYHTANAVTKDSVFGESAVYTVGEDASKTKVLNLTADTLVDYRAEDDTTTLKKAFRGVITNLNSANYAREFVAVAYIQTTVGSTVSYTFTEASDYRSVVYVSQIALAKGFEDTNSVLSGFVNAVKTAGTETTYTVEHRQEQEDGTYVTVETEELTAVIGTTVTPTAKEYDGYVTPEVAETEVLANGNTAIVLQYNLPEELSILTTADDLTARNIVAGNGGKVTFAAYAGTDAIGGRTDGVFVWTQNDASGTGTNGVIFGNSTLNASLTAGSYLYIDLYVPSAVTETEATACDIRLQDSSWYQVATAATGDNWTWYDAETGAMLIDKLNTLSSSYFGRWVTLEYQLQNDVTTSTSLVFWNPMTVGNYIYISNVRAGIGGKLPIQTGAFEVLTTAAHLSTRNIVAGNGGKVTFAAYEGTDAIGGRTDGVFVWTQNDASGTGTNGVIFGNSTLNASLTAGTYIYIDVFVPGVVGAVSSAPCDIRLQDTDWYQVASAATGDNWAWYDAATGTALTDKLNSSSNSYFGSWVTLEYQLQNDATTSTSLVFWQPMAVDNVIYISNVRASATQLDLTIAE